VKIQIIDDDRALCRSLQLQLQRAGHEARWSCGVGEGLSAMGQWRPEAVLLDLNLPDGHGLDVLPSLVEASVPVVIMTGDPANQAAVDAMRAGAFDYLRKPFDLHELFRVLARIAGQDKAPSPEGGGAKAFRLPGEMVGRDPKVLELHKQLGLLARSPVPVLIQGESGTGKELAARILHGARTPEGPFVAVNCSAVVPTLVESEFFGHEKGAFTGADQRKIGKIDHAAGGTLFFDEIGEMPLHLQAKFLRVLQEQEFVRVGGLQPIQVRARFVAATNRKLPDEVRAGRFREDLYYRLSVVTLTIPPLRERRADIPDLARSLLERIAGRLGRSVTGLADDALALLAAQEWQGNVRELENVLTRTLALSASSTLTAEDLRAHLPRPEGRAPHPPPSLTLADAERAHIARVLALQGWNITQTARALDISPTTLRKKIEDYGLRPAAAPDGASFGPS
jgi:two-component system response regulator AtoC